MLAGQRAVRPVSSAISVGAACFRCSLLGGSLPLSVASGGVKAQVCGAVDCLCPAHCCGAFGPMAAAHWQVLHMRPSPKP